MRNIARQKLRQIKYTSSVDGVDLYAYIFCSAGTAKPILVAMHGFSGNAKELCRSVTLKRWADAGVFIIVPEMRGRGQSGGSKDIGAVEIQDIIDAVEFVKINYAAVVSQTLFGITGYSGGGGNALSAVSKFPDYFVFAASHFGISDYGHDATYGWWQSVVTYRDPMNAYIGGTPTEFPNNYHSRAALLAAPNFTGGSLFLYHDDQDAAVPSNQSTRVDDAMTAAGLTNCTCNISTTTDGVRYIHGYPHESPGVVAAESDWLVDFASGNFAAWEIPVSGTLKVPGYIDTKRFSLWLGNGKEEFGQIVYDISALTFTISADTGAYTYTLKVKGQTPNTAIESTINGSAVTQTSDDNGVVAYTV